MKEQGAWKVECLSRRQGGFLLHHGEFKRALRTFKHTLFGWHQPSFYGTMLDEAEEGRVSGIAVSPVMLLELAEEPISVRWAGIAWGDSFRIAASAAQIYAKVLRDGRYRPSFDLWKQGKRGWDLQLTMEERLALEALEQEGAALGDPGLARWFDELMADAQARRDDHPDVWRMIASVRPGIETLRLPERSAAWWEEADWLEAIGWVRDETPFRLMLRLDEPEEERAPWRLRVLLQDKQQPAVQLACAYIREGRGYRAAAAEGQFPQAWQPYVDSRVHHETDKIIRLLPWLAPEEAGGGLKTLLTEAEAWRFLAEGSLVLTDAGILVAVPAWWQRARRLQTRLKAKLSGNGFTGTSYIGLEQMGQFDWKLAIGDSQFTEEQFRALLEEDRRLIYQDGQWVALNPEEAARIRRIMMKAERDGLSLGEVLELQLAAEREGLEEEEPLQREDAVRLELELNSYLQTFIDKLKHHDSIPLCEPPAGLRGELRSYQVQGFSWLAFMRRFGLGACLADDMGLGKTIQWIAYMLRIQEEEPEKVPSLLICPTSVMGNWQKELERFAPSLKVHLHYGLDRAKGEGFAAAARQADVVITTYTLALKDREELRQIAWSSLCLDEAQNIKNPYAKQSVAIRKLQARHRIALTGTPIENHLTELWSIFDFLNPGYLGSLAHFRQTYILPIERTRDKEWMQLVQRLVQPFLLRRMKSDPHIQLNLPEKHEAKVYVPLTAEQASLYEQTLQDLFAPIERMDERIDMLERRAHILAALTKLKQVCNHPAMLRKEGPAGWRPERSGKLVRLLEMLEELRSEGERCLIFTQYAETGRLLQAVLERELGERVPFLYGGVPKKERDRMVEQFQEESAAGAERASAFILSLKAGGTGLNLTAANHVFHYDRWWNPAVENQASDRAYRIGQTRNVQVHKLIALGTLEERIDDMIEQKLQLSEQVMSSGDKWITEMSTTELRELFALRSHWME